MQGDTGHSVSTMVTDVYSKIIDKNRKKTAKLIEEEFFSNEDEDDKKTADDQVEKLIDLFSSNPEMLKKIYDAVHGKGEKS